jgi:hypothetical protein
MVKGMAEAYLTMWAALGAVLSVQTLLDAAVADRTQIRRERPGRTGAPAKRSNHGRVLPVLHADFPKSEGAELRYFCRR